jgi:acetoin:2,6-dichlorophenolindophenol oxidoreductase subunit alpha
MKELTGLPVDTAREMYRRMVLIRHFEDHLYALFLQGAVPGTLHQYQGQEAVAVGVCTALRPEDVIFSTHRPVGHFLARGSSARGIAAEIMGKATGCAGGKGGQMHLTDVSIGALPSNAIVGANIPIATGAALGFQLRGQDRVAVSFFGDGASNTGAFHEGINLAAVKDAPVIFVCENNQYGASTSISSMMRIADIADRAAAYGIPGRVVDGMDVLAVYQTALEAVERARQGNGPTLLECKTYRYAGHSRGDPGGYRTREEVQHWRERDPIPHLRTWLTKELGLAEAEVKSIEQACQSEVEEAIEFASKSPEPEKEETYRHVFAEDQ